MSVSVVSNCFGYSREMATGHRMVILQGGEATAISSVDSNTTKEDMRFPKT